MKEVTTNEIKNNVSGILADAGVEHTDKEVYLLMGCAERFKKAGYNFTHEKIAEFLVSKKNLKMIEKDGLELTIMAMSKMRLGTITRQKKPNRNDPCHCGSGKKYKKCCIS